MKLNVTKKHIFEHKNSKMYLYLNIKAIVIREQLVPNYKVACTLLICRQVIVPYRKRDLLKVYNVLFWDNAPTMYSDSKYSDLFLQEICQRPKFIAEGASRFDVEQGEQGDPWLLAAVSSLTLTPKFLDRVVPPDQNFEHGYCGVFR